MATIAYGWESEAFYKKWFRRNDPDVVQRMQDPIRNPGSYQTEYAPELLKLACETLLADPTYIAHLKQHYRLFKENTDPKYFPLRRTRNRNQSDDQIQRTPSQK